MKRRVLLLSALPTLASAAGLAQAPGPTRLLTKRIPSSGEAIPADPAAMAQVNFPETRTLLPVIQPGR